MKTIGIVVGSLRKGSYNRSVAEYLQSRIPEGYKTVFIDFGQVALYSEDLEQNPPQSWVELRKSVKEVDALLFVTPEYNRSIPGGLKNALDVGSRPYGQNIWGGKPGAIISVSPGAIGGFGANHHLRQVLTFLNVYTMQQPEAYVGNITASLNAEQTIVNEATKGFLDSFTEAFVNWIGKF